MGRRRESQRPRKTLAIVATAAVLSVALAVGLFLGLSSGSGPSARPKTAAIVDQLSLRPLQGLHRQQLAETPWR